MNRLSHILLSLLFGIAACADDGGSAAETGAPGNAADTGAPDTAEADTGGDASDAADTADDTGADADTAAPCGGSCTAATPYCDTATDECVECMDNSACLDGLCDVNGELGTANVCVACLSDDDCATGVCTDLGACVECLDSDDCATGVCDTDGVSESNTCVDCLTNDDCTDPTASVCDSSFTCTACADDGGCAHLPGTALCDTSAGSGVCVECTAEDESACGQNRTCNVLTGQCVDVEPGTVDTCGQCTSDTQCAAEHRCIPMQFDSMDLPEGYCLKLVSAGCSQPFGSTIISRASLSGAQAVDYCGVPESLTTCAAVLDMKANNDTNGCSSDTDCGLAGFADGRCETVGAFDNRCTYSCDTSDQCFSSKPCGNGSASPNGDYCGGS